MEKVYSNYKIIKDADEIELGDIDEIGLDIETFPRRNLSVTDEERERHGTDPRLDVIATVQISAGKTTYILLNNFESLKEMMESRDIVKVIHTASFEYKHFQHHLGIQIREIVDVALAESLLENGKNKVRQISLAFLSKKYLDIQMNKDVRNDFMLGRRLSRAMLKYAALDAAVLVPIYHAQQELAYDGMGRVARLEFELVGPVSRIELRGVKINKKDWMAVYDENKTALNNTKEKLVKYDVSKVRRLDMFGTSSTNTNYNSRDQKKKMFKAVGIDLPDFKKTTLAEFYEKTGDKLVKLFLDYSALIKATTTYGEKFLKNINPITGRVHQQIKQMEARTGRLAGSRPNLMNLPQLSKFRRCIVAPKGRFIVAGDYTQQELGILAEYSHDERLIEAFEKKIDVHVYVARMLFHDKTIDKDSPKRKPAKNLNFGLLYGMGEIKLARSLKVPLAEAKELMLIHKESLPGVYVWHGEVIEKAKEDGYVDTLYGRRRFLDTTAFDYERQAGNTPIQGSAADMTKLAVLKLDSILPESMYIINIVHDEIALECDQKDVEEAREHLRTAMIWAARKLVKSVPMDVEIYHGERWLKK